ncbi:MAG TPA: NAD(P)/FAD-dependent oxidoreductase [Thermomicrobiales bacterium]|nr:NAD(P)/FAD-dependent oxidoreductase [Thermomicrobiales bacterium]
MNAVEPARAAPAARNIVIAGAGYAGLHAALRLAPRLADRPDATLTLIDRHDYHQVLTELPRVAAGVRPAQDVRVPLAEVLDRNVRFIRADIAGFDFAAREVRTAAGPTPYWRLLLALGSKPNDFGIPGLAERALTLYSVDDAKRVLAAVDAGVLAAANTADPAERRRRLTVIIGGAGATGVELAGELAERLPAVARRHDLPPEDCTVVLIDAGPSILAGSSPGLVARARRTLRELGVEIHTNSLIARVTERGFVLKSGEVFEGGVIVWAGGVIAPDVIAGSGLPVGHNGRVKVDRFLRALDHPEVYVAGDVASVVNPDTGRALPPMAQIAIAEGDTAATNLLAELDGGELEPFTFRDKGFVVSVGGRSGVADVAGRTFGGRAAHILKDAIEWEYRQSVKHLRGWSALA